MSHELCERRITSRICISVVEHLSSVAPSRCHDIHHSDLDNFGRNLRVQCSAVRC